ncbi:FUSC family protein [Paracoccus sp. S-4012]|uniref:FUSC family protein n=1 Tax=Paracoccus sp. S-4012 TaxID=2665648 RepID=UPI0012AF8B60|nr:FUSC family protein [Paracoccus sp. S-4012]MRX50395.1 FUSC family protein [Paracoccus sp. S-4012]
MRLSRDDIGVFLRHEWRELVTIRASDRPWEMPVGAALATGLPMLAGAAWDLMGDATLASMAGLIFVYLPRTPLHHRMVTIMGCGFGMICCFAIGALCQLVPVARVPVLALLATALTMLCRYFRIGPPGNLFFIMVAAVAAYAPAVLADLPYRIGILALGCINAAAVALIYSLHALRRRAALPIPPPPEPDFDGLWIDPVVIGLAVGLSLALAQALGLDKAYWVAVSCLAVMQGLSLRAAWNRHVHRTLGTAIGLGLTWVLLSLLAGNWEIALALTALTFLIETAIVRHYGFAAVFITPLTIILAEAPNLGGNTAALMEARLLDTVLGTSIGFAGAACLHSPAFRRRFGAMLRRLIPARYLPRRTKKPRP